MLGIGAVGPDGAYSVPPAKPLADGTYALRARARAGAGNLSSPSSALTLTIITRHGRRAPG